MLSLNIEHLNSHRSLAGSWSQLGRLHRYFIIFVRRSFNPILYRTYTKRTSPRGVAVSAGPCSKIEACVNARRRTNSTAAFECALRDRQVHTSVPSNPNRGQSSVWRPKAKRKGERLRKLHQFRYCQIYQDVINGNWIDARRASN